MSEPSYTPRVRNSSLDEARLSPFARARALRAAGRPAPSPSSRYKRILAIRRREQGQSMAEYAVVLSVVTIAVFGALALLSGNIVNAISRVAGYLT